MVVGGHQTGAGSGVGDRAEDRVVGEERVAGEVHLGDQPLGERRAEEREVDMGRAPGVVVIAPRVGAGLDGGERVAALVVGQTAADAGEVGVQRGRVLIALVGVPAGGVGLPDLDELTAYGAAGAVQDAAGDRDAFAERLAGMLPGEIGVQVGDVRDAERGAARAPRPPGRHGGRSRPAAGGGGAGRCCGTGRSPGRGAPVPEPRRPVPFAGRVQCGDLAADVGLGGEGRAGAGRSGCGSRSGGRGQRSAGRGPGCGYGGGGRDGGWVWGRGGAVTGQGRRRGRGSRRVGWVGAEPWGPSPGGGGRGGGAVGCSAVG